MRNLRAYNAMDLVKALQPSKITPAFGQRDGVL